MNEGLRRADKCDTGHCAVVKVASGSERKRWFTVVRQVSVGMYGEFVSVSVGVLANVGKRGSRGCLWSVGGRGPMDIFVFCLVVKVG